MPTLRQLLSATLASGLLLSSGTAEARFGKRSDSSDSSGTKVHGASPVGSSSDDDSSSSGSSISSTVNAVSTLVDILFLVSDIAAMTSVETTYVAMSDETPSTDDSPTQTHPYSPQPPVVVEEHRPPPDRDRVLVRMGVEGQSFGVGSAGGLNLGLEGLRWGVVASGASMDLPESVGSMGRDELKLFSAHLTYALYTSDRGRLRAEAGVATVNTPDTLFLGPSLALSFERCLFGALDLEGRSQLVPVPYLQLDAQAGLAMHLGVLTLRGGWRVLMLDDWGHVDGETNLDFLNGPYVGLGLNF